MTHIVLGVTIILLALLLLAGGWTIPINGIAIALLVLVHPILIKASENFIEKTIQT